jgi:sulfatase modifying factor 1
LEKGRHSGGNPFGYLEIKAETDMIFNKIAWGLLFSWVFIFFSPGPSGAGAVYEDPVTGIEFVFVKGGCFRMGSETGIINERPVHTACVGDFFMGKYEVTQGQWKRIMGNNPSFFDNCGDDCPVENVSWKDAQDFIRRLNQKAGAEKYRLPTEAEWEYAARAGSQAKYFFGDDAGELGNYGWYSGNSSISGAPEKLYLNELIAASSHPVGRKKPNSLGLYDLYGNVWEWVNDRYGNYTPDRAQDPTGSTSGSARVFRGGSWYTEADNCRSAKRISSHPLTTYGDLGFRLVRNP